MQTNYGIPDPQSPVPDPRSPVPDPDADLSDGDDATEEAIYNSMLKAVDTIGNGRTVRALPIEPLRMLLQKRL